MRLEISFSVTFVHGFNKNKGLTLNRIKPLSYLMATKDNNKDGRS